MESHKLHIADARLDLCFEGKGPRFADLYAPFFTDNSSERTPHIRLIYLHHPPPGPAKGPVKIEASGTTAWSLSDGFLFHRREGGMQCDRGFSRCRTWSPWRRGRPLPEPFEGSPWVILALWGWFSFHGGALLHGAVCCIDGRFVLFSGDSGVGKSTLSRLVVSAGHTCLSEENPLLTWREDAPWVHGLPWPGVSGAAAPLSGPLNAVFFLHHSPANELHILSKKEAGRRLLGNTRFFSWAPETMPPAIDLLDNTVRNTPMYQFGFTPDPSAVQVVRRVL